MDLCGVFCSQDPSVDASSCWLTILSAVTKDLKFVKGKIAKVAFFASSCIVRGSLLARPSQPYNSILGEHFHCHFDTFPVPFHPITGEPEPHLHLDENPTVEVLSAAGRTSKSPLSLNPTLSSTPVSGAQTSVASSSTSTFFNSATAHSTGNTSIALEGANGKTRVVFLNEQTSHHPPISHFMLEARGPRGRVQCVGADQLSAKVCSPSLPTTDGFARARDSELTTFCLAHFLSCAQFTGTSGSSLEERCLDLC